MVQYTNMCFFCLFDFETTDVSVWHPDVRYCFV